jgi:ABC-2 type transport system ATP-binding protein
MTASHVHVDGVVKRFGQRIALDHVGLLAQGGLCAVLGPNGAGKSTLLRCIATVLQPDEGTISIDGLDPARERERIEARGRLGYAPQDAGFDTRVRVFDAVELMAVLKGIHDDRSRRRIVFEVLDRVGLVGRSHERVGDLSGGMRKRLVLAQALIGSPSLLVLDEPAAGLDPDERLRLREILGERRRTTTVLIATHLTDEAAICDSVLVLGHSTIKFSGTPAQLARRADGRVWVQDGFPPPDARASWQQADGRHRCLGRPPDGAILAEPSLEEGYLIVQDLRPSLA